MTPSRPPLVYNGGSARVGGGLSFALAQLASLEPHFSIRLVTAPWNADAFAAKLPGIEQIRLPVPNAGSRFVLEQFLPVWYHRSVLVQPGNFSSLLAGSDRTCLVLQNPNYFGGGRTYEANQARRRRIKIALSNRSVVRSAAIVVISESLREAVLADHPDSASRIHLIPSGRPEPTRPGPLPAGIQRCRFVLSMANDYRHKNLDLVVDTWRELATIQPDLHLVMAGQIDDQRRRELTGRADGLSHRLHLLGSVKDRSVVAALYNEAEMAIAPSKLEAHPLTPAEAGLYGVPLLLSDIPPHREVAGDHASFVPPSAPTRVWAEAATSLMKTGRRRHWRPSQTWPDHGRQLAEVLHALMADTGR